MSKPFRLTEMTGTEEIDIALLSRAMLWVAGIVSSVLVMVIGYIIKYVFSNNATKSSLELSSSQLKSEISSAIQEQHTSMRTDLNALQSGQEMINRELKYVNNRIDTGDRSIVELSKRISDANESNKSMFVTKELFEQTIHSFDSKLDMLLQFMGTLQKQLDNKASNRSRS